MGILPSAREIVDKAISENPSLDVNSLHTKAYELIVFYRSGYYEARLEEILSSIDMPADLRKKITKEFLKPVDVNGKRYSNFMEEISRRVSQSIQPLSGSIAEMCVRIELEKTGLKEGINFTHREDRTDFTIYYPNIDSWESRHRIEVKNVSLRERATRGLLFDGETLFGFFDQPVEFTKSNVDWIDKICTEKEGFCYVPPALLDEINHSTKRFKPNTKFGKDMLSFAKTGEIPL